MGDFGIGKIFVIALIVILIGAIVFFATADGIINIIIEYIKQIIGNAIETAEQFLEDVINWLGFSTVKEGMYIYSITNDNVSALKTQIESMGVETDKAGITEIMLRKMLLTQAVTTSTQDTLCVAEVQANEIIANTGYTDINSYLNSLSKYNSKNEWPTDKYNYDLYYITDYFFYFQDKDNMMEKGADKYYIGIMGKISITSDTGEAIQYVSQEEFNEIKSKYDNLSSSNEKKDEDREQRKDLFRYYTYGADGKMQVYKLVENSTSYEYSFKNPNIDRIYEEGTNDDSIFDVTAISIDIQSNIDVSQYAVTIELLLNLLDLTGSPQYLDEFMDYAISKTKLSVNGYVLENRETTYKKNTFNVSGQYVYELYDIVDGADAGGDNMKLYKPLIYGRTYNGSTFSGSVVNLPNFSSIDYDGEPTEDGDTGNARPISEYLLLAYDPGANFSLGNIEVSEVIENTKYENTWEFSIKTIETWYGVINYEEPNIKTYYVVDDRDATKDEYNNFSADSSSTYTSLADENKRDIFIAKVRANEVGITTESNPDVTVIDYGDTNDIYDNILKRRLGKNNREYFDNWTLRGLGKVSANDGGTKNTETGAGSGSDYLYAKFTKTNVRQYDDATKSKEEVVEDSTVLPTYDMNRIYDFLALWKNSTGTIGGTSYASDGIKVKYNDIYGGTIAVGDIFESAPEMLFQLLETSESTRKTVNVFKYIMYIYTGKDYGITDSAMISSMFSMSTYGGSDYIVNTSMSPNDLVLTKDKLAEAIEKTYSGKTKQNLLSCVDDFIYVQDTNKVNAVFAVAVTINESSGGTKWDVIDSSTYNWQSIRGSYNGNSYTDSIGRKWKAYSSFNEATRDFGDLIANGSYYFKAGKYTITTIAPTYCDEAWGTSVISEMTKIYNSIGITGATGGIEGIEGNVTTFTVGNRTYKNYTQKEEAYKNIKLACYDTTLYKAGCGITSDAIIGSGFGNSSTPVDVNNLGSNVHTEILKKLTGKEWTKIDTFSKSAVIEELKKGNPVMVRVEGNGGYFESSGHYLVILSISDDGQKIYISDPAFNHRQTNHGWMKTSILDASGYCQYTKLK